MGWEEELEKEFNTLVETFANSYKLSPEDIINKLLDIVSFASEQIISGNTFNNSSVVFKAEKVRIGGEQKKVVIQRDERIHASPKEINKIREKVKELAELLIKAFENGLSRMSLRLDFRPSANPYPAIYDELRRRFKYLNLNLVEKSLVPRILKQLDIWIGNVAYALYKNGIPPYSRDVMIRKYYYACKSRGKDPKEWARKKLGTDNLSEVDLLEMYKVYRNLLSRRRK